MTARLLLAGLAALLVAAPPAAAKVDYGPISHSGMKSLGQAPTGKKLTLQIGLIADQKGIATSARNTSNPASSSYGKYPSLSTLQKNWGASSSKRNGVVNAFKKYGVTATVDVTHLRVTATVSIKTAQKMFGTKWSQYESGGATIALPVNTPKLPSGISGNVDTIAGMRLTLSGNPTARAAQAPAGGSPTRTGTPGPSCLNTDDPGVAFGRNGLLPNQILTAYGISNLQGQGLLGQGSRVTIVGEAPTPTSDLNTFRSCFGFAGTPLTIAGVSGVTPILESSLDAQVVSMVAPQLSSFTLRVQPLDEDEDDGDVEGFLKMLASPLQATTNGAKLPHVISVSYGVCESTVKPYTASRTLVERTLAAEAALGITVVVAAGDSGSSACSRGVPPSQLTSADKAPATSWPATSPWVLAVGGTNLALNEDNSIAASEPWNDSVYPAPYTASAGGGGGLSVITSRQAWQPQSSSSTKRMVPDVAAFADESPGYIVVCSSGVQSCPPGPSPNYTFVGGTSAAAPLVSGMIALWTQRASQLGLPRPGFVPPLLYSLAASSPQAFLDVTQGTNAIFPGLSCCTAGPGYDLASGLGSPRADQVAALLPRGAGGR